MSKDDCFIGVGLEQWSVSEMFSDLRGKNLSEGLPGSCRVGLQLGCFWEVGPWSSAVLLHPCDFAVILSLSVVNF